MLALSTMPSPSPSEITLRDQFAAQALVAMGTWAPPFKYDLDIDFQSPEWWRLAHQQRAIYAYAQADAMLAERAK